MSSVSFILTVISLLLLHPVAISEPVQPFLLPSSSTPASTIPAFPEQSDVASSCPLHLPPELFPAVARSCSSPSPTPSFRLRCCPALAAWLYSAYSPSALSLTLRSSSPSADLPLLPDDSESCIDSVQKTLRSNGVSLPPLNDTCDVAYCFCGIRLRPFSCSHGLSVAKDQGRWIAKDDKSKRIERDCTRPGLSGCSRCLHSLQQIKSAASNASTISGSSKREGNGRYRDCELLVLTWLLATNRTKYLPTATKVLRAFMVTPDGKDPATCASRNGMPLAVDSAEFDDSVSSAAAIGSLTLGHRGCWIAGTIYVVLMLVVSVVV